MLFKKGKLRYPNLIWEFLFFKCSIELINKNVLI